MDGAESATSKILLVGFKYQIRAIQGASVDPAASPLKKPNPENWKIKMLYDGDCPLCMREVNMLRERNEKHGAIKFVDISSNDYSPEENQGLDYKTVMGQIHAIQSDGNVVTGVEAFRRLYEEVGLGWVYTITKFEPVRQINSVIVLAGRKKHVVIARRARCEFLYMIVLELLLPIPKPIRSSLHFLY